MMRHVQYSPVQTADSGPPRPPWCRTDAWVNPIFSVPCHEVEAWRQRGRRRQQQHSHGYHHRAHLTVEYGFAEAALRRAVVGESLGATDGEAHAEVTTQHVHHEGPGVGGKQPVGAPAVEVEWRARGDVHEVGTLAACIHGIGNFHGGVEDLR